MSLTATELRSVQRERLRALISLLEFTPPGPRHDELVERTRALVGAIRQNQVAVPALVATGGRAGAAVSKRMTV